MSPVQSRVRLTRRQILAFRRRVGGLDERVPKGPESLRRAAWAGLQDSMPRAALLSLHARIEGVESSTWEDPSLAQLWGPRYSAYVVPKRDFALFSLGRLPDDDKGRLRAERMAELLHGGLQGARMTDREVGRAIGIGNAMRYAATTGTVAIRWEGARAPVVWTVPAPRSSRWTHVASSPGATCTSSGPTTAASSPAGRGSRGARGPTAFASLEESLLPVRSPLGDEWLLAEDEPAMRAAETAAAPARLLPSGDAYFLLDRKERELLVPRADRRPLLWTSRVWPGALLVEGEIRGTWRRSQHVVTIDAWDGRRAGEREAVEIEAATLPLPGLDRPIEVVWNI